MKARRNRPETKSAAISRHLKKILKKIPQSVYDIDVYNETMRRFPTHTTFGGSEAPIGWNEDGLRIAFFLLWMTGRNVETE